MIGINAVVMDEAEIGESCIVAALTYVKPGFSAPPGSVVAGIPAVVKRGLTADELAWKNEGTALYQRLAARSRATMIEVSPMEREEDQRPRYTADDLKPLHLHRNS